MGDSSLREALLQRHVALMGLVAHDVKNPISAALANLAFVEQVGVADSDARDAIADAVDAVKRVRQLVEDLVVTSRHEANVLKLHRTVQPLDPLVNFAVAALVKDAELRRTGLDAHASTATAPVDGPTVRRALELLVDCALRWGKPGGRVTVSAVATGEGAVLSVAHSACVLGDHARATAFMSDHDAPPATIGLSLYYAHCVARAHGGRLVLRSEPALFSMELA